MLLCDLYRSDRHADRREDFHHRDAGNAARHPRSVDAGEYASTSEVVRHAMRLWQRERDEHAERIAAIKTRIRKSLDDPRPSLSEEEARQAIETMFDEVDKEMGHAKAQGRVSA